MTPAKKWILAIVGLLSANMIATGVLIAEAHHGASRVLPTYYERAVHYDDAIDQAARDRRLGWRVHVTIERGIIVATVTDAAGALLTAARIHIVGYARTGTEQPFTVDLTPDSRGIYRGPLAGLGWIDLIVTIVRGDETFVANVTTEAR